MVLCVGEVSCEAGLEISTFLFFTLLNSFFKVFLDFSQVFRPLVLFAFRNIESYHIGHCQNLRVMEVLICEGAHHGNQIDLLIDYWEHVIKVASIRSAEEGLIVVFS